MLPTSLCCDGEWRNHDVERLFSRCKTWKHWKLQTAKLQILCDLAASIHVFTDLRDEEPLLCARRKKTQAVNASRGPPRPRHGAEAHLHEGTNGAASTSTFCNTFYAPNARNARLDSGKAETRGVERREGIICGEF